MFDNVYASDENTRKPSFFIKGGAFTGRRG
jgi:hypothetical protein